MDNRTLGEVNYLAVGFVIVQLIFCAICASSISTLMAEEKVNVDDYVDKFSIDIKNIDALQDGLTDAQVGTIQRSFLNVVQRNAFQINLGSNEIGRAHV